MQLDKIFSTQFIDPDTRLPITNLTGVTFTLVEVSEADWITVSTVVDAQPCINGWFWFYRYYYSAMNPNKVYEGFFNPNDSRCYPSPIHVDKRMNNLDQAVSDIRGWGGGWGFINYEAINSNIRNSTKIITEELTKNHTQTLDKFNETNSHIELAKTDLSDKIELIDIPEAILEEKEAKKAIKLIQGVDKKLTAYIDSETSEKEELSAIARELNRLDMEDEKNMREKKQKEEDEKRMKEQEHKKMLEEQAKMLELEFDKLEEEEKIEKKKELEKELEETLKEADEIKKELKTL